MRHQETKLATKFFICIYILEFVDKFVFVFVIEFVFGTQLALVEQTLIVYQAQTQTIGYETGFEYKNLCLCRSTPTEFVFSERSQY